LPEEKNNNRLYLFGTVTFLFWFSLYAYVPILSPYLESIEIDYRMIGIIIGSYGLVQTILRVPLGMVSDKIRKRKIFIVVGLFCSIISSVGIWYFKEPLLVLFFRSLSGVTATTWVVITVLFSAYFKKEETAKAMGILHSSRALGQVLAMVISGVATWYYGMPVAFLIAALGAFFAFALSFWIVERVSEGIETSDSSEISNFKNLFSERSLVVASFLALLSQIITQSTFFGFTPVVAKHLGASSLEVYLLTIIAVSPAIAVSYLGPSIISKKMGFKTTMMIAFLLSGIPSFLIPVVGQLYLLYALQVVAGVGRGILFPMLMGLSIEPFADNQRAAAMGFFQAVYGIGMFLGPALVGSLSDSVGIIAGFWLTGLVGLLGLVLTRQLLPATTPRRG